MSLLPHSIRTLAWRTLASCFFLVLHTSTSHAETPPNVVIIVGDDQHWKDYGFMGHPHLKTPHLDQLASESLQFSRGYVPSSLCSPSLASIISGLYPHQHKITSNDPVGGNKTKKLTDTNFVAGRARYNEYMSALPTLPRLLAQKGYLSLQTGKWWQGSYETGGFTHGMTRGSRHGDAGLKIGREGNEPVHQFMDEATSANRPFFIWYAPFMPHTPHTPPQAYLDRYLKIAPDEKTAKYWAMIEWFDECCGELLKSLEDRQLRDNTLVIFLCDNGFLPADQGYDARTKQSQYDGGLRTPILVRWPGKVAPAKLDDLVSSIDVAPTVLDAVGLPQAPQMQGLSLLEPEMLKSRDTVFGEIFTHDSQDFENPAKSLRWRYIVKGNHKLVVPSLQEPEAVVELYDLEKDSDERNNLTGQKPQKAEALLKVLDAWWKPEL